jgi:type VI secretion system protein ImpA
MADLGEAYGAVVHSAEFFFDSNPTSPVPYLVCAGLRLGETRTQGAEPAPGFALAPTAEMRQSLRRLAQRGAWRELLRTSLSFLASPAARAWLDLHRYIWRAARETGAEALALAVEATVRSLIEARPEARYWTLEDDTSGANHETQQWLDTTVLQPR